MTPNALLSSVQASVAATGYVSFTSELCVSLGLTLHIESNMRTNIVIDDKLMSDALKATGVETKREVVELGLMLLVRQNKQQAIRKLRGKLHWEGDLDEMRGGK